MAVTAVVGLTAGGCAGGADTAADRSRRTTGYTAPAPPSPSVQPAKEVAPLERRVSPDLLIRTTEPLPASAVRRAGDMSGVREAVAVGVGSATLHEEAVMVAAVQPSTYRAFAPEGTAESDDLWQRVAAGDAAVGHAVAERLRLSLGDTATLAGEHQVRLGAFATTVPGIDVVVDRAVGDRLGVPDDNTLLVAVRPKAESRVDEIVSGLRKIARKAVDGRVRVQRLGEPAPASDGDPLQRAFLTGDAAARAFGSFQYRWLSNGRLWIDPAFVRKNIRTGRVPILGEVRCHRLMFPQLRGALQEVVDRGLASAIHPDQYGGCFVPKGIEGSPGAVSLHTWGIAIDLNVPGNLRGTEGEIDRRVVAIFKRWGFAWGGDWSWTDPMHFEMAGLLTDSAG